MRLLVSNPNPNLTLTLTLTLGLSRAACRLGPETRTQPATTPSRTVVLLWLHTTHCRRAESMPCAACPPSKSTRKPYREQGPQ